MTRRLAKIKVKGKVTHRGAVPDRELSLISTIVLFYVKKVKVTHTRLPSVGFRS